MRACAETKMRKRYLNSRLTFLESEHENALKGAKREQAEQRRRQQRAHAQALRRGREKQKHVIDLKHEVRMKGQTIDALVAKLGITQLQQEANWLITGIEQIEKEAVESQQRIESTLKVPTNQLKPVVEAVLNMMGSRAKNNVTGASDDTTKLQKKIAADLAHFRLPDGSLRTLCIGLSCLPW
mmetsp:Transcript_20137/g.50252  ORF Transcript_20137/g.50252 Transcript_20137/m.50252 type:complete len:183 (-) Transcript_20137:1245-1793(-)